MKVLIVCSKNSGKIAPFIEEQVVSLKKCGLMLEYYTVQGKGVVGYMKNYKPLQSKIRDYKPDIIHAHYGLSGLLANLQRKVPVITTYHGSDINDSRVYRFSRISMMLSAHNIFVSEKNLDKAEKTPRPLSPFGYFLQKEKDNRNPNIVYLKNSLIPCGVETDFFKPFDKVEARKILNLDNDKKYCLFAGAFDNKVKNAELAIHAVALIPNLTLLELKGYSRQEVVYLMNAVDVVLMTSFTEGSPQFIKEAMACNRPIVSVLVGDVPEVIDGVEGCYITSYEMEDVADKIKVALEFGKETNGRERIMELKLDSDTVVKRILEVYNSVSSKQ